MMNDLVDGQQKQHNSRSAAREAVIAAKERFILERRRPGSTVDTRKEANNSKIVTKLGRQQRST